MTPEEKAKLGEEFAAVLVFKQGGKVVKAPAKGDVTIAMRRGMDFHGEPAKALSYLEAAFPGCKFAWES